MINQRPLDTDPAFENNLAKYARLAIQVGLNLQAGQRLVINAPIEATALVRLIATEAYQTGARLVDVQWEDELLRRIRLQHAPRDSLQEYPVWRSRAMEQYAQAGDAQLFISGSDPDLTQDQDPQAVATIQRTNWQHMQPLFDLITKHATNWSVIAHPVPDWAAKVLPKTPQEQRQAKLWEAIFDICRLRPADPVAAWNAHNDELLARSAYLNAKQYQGLQFSGPGTNLRLGLPAGHVWQSARFASQAGIPFTANLPSEEIFTLPHRNEAEGVVTSSRPLSYGNTVIDRFHLRFEKGRVVHAVADRGEAVLQELVGTDEGASRLGEVALVPHSSPISQLGLLFFNTLIDENAASHLALGRAYNFSLRDGQEMSSDAFLAAGGNHSLTHVDFMIGSEKLDVDGKRDNGALEPVMRQGEWAFDL
jgi:aminopeptidase